MQRTNTLVVGQGIAGTLVAFMLHQQGVPFIVIDTVDENTASRVAAGMFTPISGKRKTIQPLVLQQISYAVKTYQEIEQLLGISFLHLQNIHYVYNSLSEKDELVTKSIQPESSKYIVTNVESIPGIKEEMGACEINHSGWVDCGAMINGFARWLQQNNALIESVFEYEKLLITNETMQYNGIEFSNIIFCEGYRAIHNPFFSKENIIACKGDVLTVAYYQPITNKIIKKNGIYLVPFGDNLFRAGSTYQWNNDTALPDEASKKLIENKLDYMLEKGYSTIAHRAAIRPTTKDREGIAKQHPQYAGMFMLNGLGTKGVLQGPWRAAHLVQLCLAADNKYTSS
ncbi:MAG: FAD-dependent oxidoreductase [Ferruginibacter sp.]